MLESCGTFSKWSVNEGSGSLGGLERLHSLVPLLVYSVLPDSGLNVANSSLSLPPRLLCHCGLHLPKEQAEENHSHVKLFPVSYVVTIRRETTEPRGPG